MKKRLNTFVCDSGYVPGKIFPAPKGYRFYGNSSRETKKEALGGYSIWGIGAYWIKDLKARTMFNRRGTITYAVFVREGAENISMRKSNKPKSESKRYVRHPKV